MAIVVDGRGRGWCVVGPSSLQVDAAGSERTVAQCSYKRYIAMVQIGTRELKNRLSLDFHTGGSDNNGGRVGRLCELQRVAS